MASAQDLPVDRLESWLLGNAPLDRRWLEQGSLWLTTPEAWAQAERTVESGYRSNPDHKDGFARLGFYCLRQGDLPAAQRYFESDLAARRISWWQTVRYIECLARSGNQPAAEAAAEQLYAAIPAARNAWSAIADVVAERGELPAALDYYERDWRAGRMTPGCMLNRAVTLARAGQDGPARESVARAYAGDATLKDGFARLADLIQAPERQDAAADLVGLDVQQLRLSPHHYERALNFARLRNQWEALACWIADIYAHDLPAAALCSHVGRLLYRERNFALAQEWFARDAAARRLPPADLHAWAVCLMETGALEQAATVMEQAYRYSPDYRDGLSRIAWRLYSQRQVQPARALMARDFEAGRQSPTHMLFHAAVLADGGDWDAAQRMADDAYARDPQIRDGRSRVGWLLTLHGRVADGLALLEQDFREGRQTPGWMLNHAALAADHGAIEPALALVQAAYAADGHLQDGRLCVAWTLRRQGDLPAAIRLLEQDAQQQRQSDYGRWIYLVTLGAAGRVADGLALARRTQQLRGAGTALAQGVLDRTLRQWAAAGTLADPEHDLQPVLDLLAIDQPPHDLAVTETSRHMVRDALAWLANPTAGTALMRPAELLAHLIPYVDHEFQHPRNARDAAAHGDRAQAILAAWLQAGRDLERIRAAWPEITGTTAAEALQTDRDIRARIAGRGVGDPGDKLAQYCAVTLVLHTLRPARLEALEIGTLYGGSCLLILLACRAAGIPAHMVCIDPMSGYYGHAMDVSRVPITPETFYGNLERFAVPRATVDLRRSFSTDPAAYQDLAPGRFHFILIDGDHSRAGVLRDWELYHPLAAPGGRVLFDDYGEPAWPEVTQAVDEIKTRLPAGWRVEAHIGTTLVLAREPAPGAT